MKVTDFKKLPVLGIIRGIDASAVEPLVETIVASGLETIEITMNTPGAAGLIKKACKASSGRLTIGAGTVLDLKDLKQALESGATFIVTPVLVEEVTGYCVKNRIPVFPGALTPSEIYKAWDNGATMVKVFPAKFFGPEYFKEIKGPFSQIELLACAGVTAQNMKDYFQNGASAVTFGANVFRKDWIKDGDYKKIGAKIAEFVKSYKEMK